VTSNSSIVSVDRLRKDYGVLRALDGCSLSIPRGSIFGLLGPNGAGKTTLIRSLLGFVRPTGGRASIDDLDVVKQSLEVRRRVAYLPAEAKLFRMMRGKMALEFFSQMHPTGSSDRALKIAERLRLDLSRRVAFMSTGMRQKLAIASVLSCRPPLLILDEPTASLDPSIRKEVMGMIRESREDGCTVLFSSHILSEIEEVCDHACFMMAGKVAQEIDIHQMRRCHRILFDTEQLPSVFTDGVPSHVRWIERSSNTGCVIEIENGLEDSLAWFLQMKPVNIRIEPVGLKHRYESCFASS
jgi:ABC-2 type transport system ATP-binding protein